MDDSKEDLTPQQQEQLEDIAKTLGGEVVSGQAAATEQEETPEQAEKRMERERQRAISKERYPNYYRLYDALTEKYKQEGTWLHIYFDQHKEDEMYDNLTIDIVPRYKQSYMSGDEWRFSYRARLWWKGFLIGKHSMSSMEHITRTLDYWLNYMNEVIQFRYKEYSDGSGKEEMINWPDHRLRTEYCAQPGCPNIATHTFVKKKTWTKNGMAETTKENHIHVIRYCPKHTTRGDCALEDSDSNLELFEALAERDETERYERSVNSAVAYIKLDADQFGIGQLPVEMDWTNITIAEEDEGMTDADG